LTLQTDQIHLGRWDEIKHLVWRLKWQTVLYSRTKRFPGKIIAILDRSVGDGTMEYASDENQTIAFVVQLLVKSPNQIWRAG
jgi:hypothetical protein